MDECISCGKRAGYNRVVVDEVTDRRLGGFCRNCEFEVFGQTLSKIHSHEDSCVLCARDGHYAFPIWRPYEKSTESKVTCDVTFDVSERTPRLCDEHYHDLRDDEDEASVVRRGHP